MAEEERFRKWKKNERKGKKKTFKIGFLKRRGYGDENKKEKERKIQYKGKRIGKI